MRLIRLNQLFLTTLAACVLVACGGGDSVTVSNAGGYTVESGVAQKGPLAQGSLILINELATTTYNQNGKEYTFRTSNNLGAFDPSGYTFSTPYLSTVAQGYYFNEITGTQADDMVLLSGVSQIGKVGTVAADTAINVNVLSSMAVNRTLKLAKSKPVVTFAAARAQAQKEVLAAFNIYNGAAILTGATTAGVTQPANLTALDLSKSRSGDQLLAAISAVVMQAGGNGAGVNALLSRAASDLADDGVLNNSTNYATSVKSQLCAAAASTDFAKVATNLNTLYGTNYSATDLGQWVDTSGCLDQVIDKYKYSGAGATSPAYTVSVDDVGQCFSVTTGTLNKNGAVVVGGVTQSIVGDKFTITISPAAASTAYIQRTNPSSNGQCQLPTQSSVTTKVLKYIALSPMVSTMAITGVISGPTGPQNITFDNIGNLYIADPSGHVIRKITPAGVSSVFAGTGAYGSLDGPAASATFSTPYSLVFDRSGNMYVADADNNKIRKITTAGVVSTFAGNGTSTSIDGNGLSASINHPINLAIDPNSNIYVSDENGQKIRKIDTSGNVTTIAGTGQIGSVDGAASSSSFYRPHGLVFDTGGNLYVADYGNSKIRKITLSGIVSNFAGSGAQKSVDGIGSDAGIYAPANIVIDATGNIYANVIDNKIIKISPQGVVTTLAGSGQAGKADGIGISATFNCPMGLAIGPNGSLYVSDACNNEIRIINFNY